MSHHHPHDHDHDHGDHHANDHHHGHAHSQAPLSFPEKLVKLLDHWIQHNDHHVEDYRQWAGKARENGQSAVAALLDAAAELTDTISDRFREASKAVQETPED